MKGIALSDRKAAFLAWNALWEGALAAHNREFSLHAEFDGENILWRTDKR